MISLPKPYYYGKWAIFPNTGLKIPTCEDTIYSKCVPSPNVEHCIDLCKQKGDPHNLCDAGWYADGQCGPLESENYPKVNPIYNSTPKEGSALYINTEMFPFPPDNANAVFYYDQFQLYSVEEDQNVSLEESDSDVLQIIPLEAGIAIDEYQTLYYEDLFGFKIPNSTLILRPTIDLTLHFLPVYTRTAEKLNNFTVNSVDGKSGEVAYGDHIYITYQDVNTLVYRGGKLKLIYGKYQELKDKGESCTFWFVPKLHGFYCDGTECKKVLLEHTQTDGVKARYKGKVVYSSGCLGTCQYEVDTRWSVLIHSIIVVLVLLIIGIGLYLVFR